MNVLIEATAHPGGGSITYLNKLLDRVAGTHDQYRIIVPQGRNALADHDAPNIEFIETAFPVGNPALREIYRQIVLPLLLLNSDVDVLFSTGDITSLLSPISTVVIVHNLAPYATTLGRTVGTRRRLRNIIHRTMTRLSVQRAARVIWVSEFTSTTVRDRFNIAEDKGQVIYHGINSDTFDPPTSPDDTTSRTVEQYEPYLLAVSTVNKHKNYETLIKAFNQLPDEYSSKYQLLIVGRQPDEDYIAELQDLVQTLELADRVHFLGGLPRESLPHLYANATLYVYPSAIESFGLTPLEAMAAGTPVVAARATSIPEICGDAAAYFDPADPEDTAQVITRVLSDPARQRNLVSAGGERVELFDWETTARKTEALLCAAGKSSKKQ